MHPLHSDASQTAPSSRISINMLILIMLIPMITGFDHQAPLTAAVNSTEGAPVIEVRQQASQQTPPQQPAADQASQQPATERSGSSLTWRREKENPVRFAAAGPDATAARNDPAPEKVHSWETGAGKSCLIPALEVPAFLILLNTHDRIALRDERGENGERTYSSTFSSTWEHLRRQNWKFDTDPFNTNQFAHPYQGATMYGLARSSGLGFWESAAYSNLGSFLWEMAGETSPPSINDIATTGTSGSLLGEALFRMSSLVLQNGGESPDLWHELGAAIVSPSSAFNRLAFGKRFKTVFPSYAPATFWRFRLGTTLSGNSQQSATLDFAMSYGLPGKRGYSYTRPLDYFDFQISGLSSSSNPLSSVLLRGLLYGRPYQAGDNCRGIWGVYGSYDYISPGSFRVSNTALSLGSTAQYWVGPDIALQGSLLAGAGFGAAGVTPAADGDRDYHYGVTPQGILALRLLFGTRAALEMVGRGYYVSGTGSDNSEGAERIVRATANFNIRVIGRHGVGLGFTESIRDAHYGNLPSRQQRDGTLSLVYTFLGDTHFGAVEWRNPGDR
ncbi:MAG: hypothetical protein A2075_17375 [Geobacteraceae bacterium GWC2_58_44]|nr:MAG: hypothetical protein A2075_17375 [Geobacteraceae bacterium GWC2_58_44]HBG05079.1 DUF3943 domain-containing protein [Geobacter sp.]